MIQLAKSGVNYELRGEGMTNFVVGFVRDGDHVVWRIRKEDLLIKEINYYVNEKKDSSMSVDGCQLHIRYIKEFILPVFGPNGAKNFIILPTPVYLNGQQLVEIHSRLQIISLNDTGYSHYFLPETMMITALEMPDFTRFIPKSILIKDWHRYPVVGVEIKPKQGFIPDDLRQISKKIFGIDKIAYCTNCLSQYERCFVGGDLGKLYDYCPLDLYSGIRTRMRRAFEDLLTRPKTHLRIVRDGQVVLDKNRNLNCQDVSDLLFIDGGRGDNYDFTDVLIRVLLSTNEKNPAERCGLPEGSVLDALIQSQRADQLGPINTGALIEDLRETTNFIRDPGDALAFFFNDIDSVDEPARSKLKLLRHGLLAHTMRDCSIMITMQIFEHDGENCDTDDATGFSPIHLGDRYWLKFNVTIVDLDAKTPVKVLRFCRRIIEAMHSLKDQRDQGTFFRIPCNQRGDCNLT